MAPDEPLKTLNRIAKQFRRTPSNTKIYDANVCHAVHDPERPWDVTTFSGAPFSHSLTYMYRRRKVKLLANDVYVNENITGIFALRPFSINEPQKIPGFASTRAKTLSVEKEKFAVFTKDGRLTASERDLFKRGELLSLVKHAGLRAGESIHFFSDSISVYLRTPSFSRVTDSIDRIIDLADQLEALEPELDLQGLPTQFHVLIPLIKKCGIADDFDRDEFLSNLPRQSLQQLTEIVTPFLRTIDSYLDSFDETPPNEQAIALGRLAECALEAKQLLKQSKE